MKYKPNVQGKLLTIRLEPNIDKLENSFKRLENDVYVAAGVDTNEIAQIYIDWLVLSAFNSGIEPWTGKLIETLDKPRRYKSSAGYTYTIFVPKYGIYLDRMEPHYAPLASPHLRKWYEEKVKPFVKLRRKRGPGIGRKGYIYVRPHPWIKDGIEQADKFVQEYLEVCNVRKAVRNANKRR